MEYKADFLTGAVSFLIDQAVGIAWCVGYFIVKKGDFDKYLTRPINPLFHVIAETFQVDAIGELVVGIALMVYVSGSVNLYITPLSVALFIVVIPFATLIYTAIKIATGALAFWIKSSGFIIQMVYGMNEFAKYPTTIYSLFIRTFITYIIPFAFTGYYPCIYLLTGQNPLFNIGGTVLISVIVMLVALLIWHKGLSAYESAGS